MFVFLSLENKPEKSVLVTSTPDLSKVLTTLLALLSHTGLDIQNLLGHKHRSSTETYLHRDKKRKQICINVKCEKRKEYKNLRESSKTAPKLPIGIKNTKIAI